MDYSANLSTAASKPASPQAPASGVSPVPGATELGGIAGDLRASGWVFAGVIGAAALLRLALEPNHWHLAYAGLLLAAALYGWGQARIVRIPSPGRLRTGLAINFLAVCLGYALIGAAMSAVGWRADDALYQAEKTIFGGDPQRFLESWHMPWVSTVTILGYIGFVVVLIYLFLSEAFTLSRATGTLQRRLMLLYGIGYGGYLLVPAAGPGFHHGAALGPVPQTAFSQYFYDWVVSSCSRVDAFPSLHGGVCCFALIWTYRRHPRAFGFLLVPALALLVGTVYFRFHYFIDIISGGLLAALCLLSLPDQPSSQR